MFTEKSLLPGLAPRGTPWYYATLYQPSDTRQNLLALQAWWRAVRGIPYSVSDAGVAGAKLAWWEAQVRACQNGRPDHPLLLALQPALRHAGVPATSLLTPLAHAGAGLGQSRWLDWRSLEHYLDAGPGHVARIACQILGQRTEAALTWATALGLALAQVAIVRDVGRDARRGVIYFPLEELQAHGVKAQMLLSCEHTPQIQALLEAAAAKASAALEEADALRPRAMGKESLPGIALSHMAHALLREMQRERYAILNQRISLPPTRMLWASWRAKWTR